jgi:hypothetical protein
MIESEIFYIIWGAAGICMVCSYFMGKSAGYKNLQFKIASSIIDIHSEKEKIKTMKKELLDIQEATEKLIKETKDVTQT